MNYRELALALSIVMLAGCSGEISTHVPNVVKNTPSVENPTPVETLKPVENPPITQPPTPVPTTPTPPPQPIQEVLPVVTQINGFTPIEPFAQHKTIVKYTGEDAFSEQPFEYQVDAFFKISVDPAEGKMPNVKRVVHLFKKYDQGWVEVNNVELPYMIGNSIRFSNNLISGHNAIVIEAKRDHGVRYGAVEIVNGRLEALDFYRLIAPEPEIKEGTYLYLDKYLNELWVFKDGQLVDYFPTANGRDPWGPQPTWSDFKTNYTTPEGKFVVKSRVVNPAYNSLSGNPSAAGGSPNNPLGTRWVGFEVLSGDSGGIWGFHGTNVPDQIGTWASEGCIRLNTADVEKLYDLAPSGTVVRIVKGR